METKTSPLQVPAENKLQGYFPWMSRSQSRRIIARKNKGSDLTPDEEREISLKSQFDAAYQPDPLLTDEENRAMRDNLYQESRKKQVDEEMMQEALDRGARKAETNPYLLEKMRREGEELTEDQSRILYFKDRNLPFPAKVGNFISGIPEAAKGAYDLGKGASRLLWGGVAKPALSSANRTIEEMEKDNQEASDLQRSYASGVIKGAEEIAVDNVKIAAAGGTPITDSLNELGTPLSTLMDAAGKRMSPGSFGDLGGLIVDTNIPQKQTEEESFQNSLKREAVRRDIAAEKQAHPDRAARMMENLASSASLIAEKTLSKLEPPDGDKKFTKSATTFLDNLATEFSERALPEERIDPYVSEFGDFLGIDLPIMNRLLGFTPKAIEGLGVAARKGATGVKLGEKSYGVGPAARVTGKTIRKIGEGAKGIAEKMDDALFGDDFLFANSIGKASKFLSTPGSWVENAGQAAMDIGKAAELGSAGRKGLFSRVGADPDRGVFMDRMFGSKEKYLAWKKARLSPSKAIDRADRYAQKMSPEALEKNWKAGQWRARQVDRALGLSRYYAENGINGAAVQMILGIPNLENSDIAGEMFWSGVGMGIFSASGPTNLFQNRKGMAQRRGAEADIARWRQSLPQETLNAIDGISSMDGFVRMQEKRKGFSQARKENIQKNIDDNIYSDEEKEVAKDLIKVLDQHIEEADQNIKNASEQDPATQKEIQFLINKEIMDSVGSMKVLGENAGVGADIDIQFLSTEGIRNKVAQIYAPYLQSAKETIDALSSSTTLSPEDQARLKDATDFLRWFEGQQKDEASARGFQKSSAADRTTLGWWKSGSPVSVPTVFVNTDLLASSRGLDLHRVLRHEVFHGISRFQEVQDLIAKETEGLFDQWAVGEDGKPVKIEDGIISDDQLLEMAKKYSSHFTGPMKDLWDSWMYGNDPRQAVDKIKSEVLAELFTYSGGEMGMTSQMEDSAAQKFVDWVKTRESNSKMGKIRDLLGRQGISLGDDGTVKSDVLGDLPMQAIHLIRQFRRELSSYRGGLTQADKADFNNAGISLAKIAASPALRKKYRGANFFAKEAYVQVTKPDGTVVKTEIPKDQKSVSTGKWVVQGGKLVPQDGSLAAPTSIVDAAIGQPDGAVIISGIRDKETASGAGVLLTQKDIEANDRERGKTIREALDNAPDDGAPSRLKDTGNGSYRGTMSPSQQAAILNIPDIILPPKLKDYILKLNDILQRKDGTVIVNEYQARLRGGKYRSMAPRVNEEVPIGFQFSKADNFLVVTISVTRLDRKIDAWLREKPQRLAPWGGSKSAMWSDFRKYLNNWKEGRAGEIGLAGGYSDAVVKKNILNDLLNLYRKETEGANPDRTKLSVKRGQDSADRTIASRRLDAILQLEESSAEKLPIDYEKAVNNYLPSADESEQIENPEGQKISLDEAKRIAAANSDMDPAKLELIREMTDKLQEENPDMLPEQVNATAAEQANQFQAAAQSVVRQREILESTADKLHSLLSERGILSDYDPSTQFLPDIDRDGFKDVKKVYGETLAKAFRSDLPSALDHSEKFLEWAKKFVPVKKHLAKIYQENPEAISSSFLEFLSKRDGVAVKKTRKTTGSSSEVLRPTGRSIEKIRDLDHLLSFRRYYRGNKGERICTYSAPKRRLANYHIFTLMTEGFDKIPAADELTPQNLTDGWKKHLEEMGRKKANGTFDLKNVPRMRQDPYGTSLLSVQINRTNGSLKIINRYNHNIERGPRTADAAFDRNLNSIAEGLFNALNAETEGVLLGNEGIGLQRNFVGEKGGINETGEGLVYVADGRMFFADGEIDGVIYGEGFIIENGRIRITDTNNERVVMGLVLKDNSYPDETYSEFGQLVSNTKIKISGNTIQGIYREASSPGKKGREYVRWSGKLDGAEFVSFTYQAEDLHGTGLFHKWKKLKELHLPNVRYFPESTASHNRALEILDAPNLESINDLSLCGNSSMKIIDLPNAKYVGISCLMYNPALELISLPKLETLHASSIINNRSLESVDISKARIIGDGSLSSNRSLKIVDISSVREIGDEALSDNKSLEVLKAPKLITIGSESICKNNSLKSVYLPKAETVEKLSLNHNDSLEELNLPRVTSVKSGSLSHNPKLKTINLPKARMIEHITITDNPSLETVNAPKEAYLSPVSAKKWKSSNANTDFLPSIRSDQESQQETEENQLVEELKTRIKPAIENASDQLIDLFDMGTPSEFLPNAPDPNRDGYKDIKKVYGETVARKLRSELPAAIDNPERFLKWAKEFIPVKSHFAEILEIDEDIIKERFLESLFEDDKPEVEEKVVDSRTAEQLLATKNYTFTSIRDFEHLLTFKRDYRDENNAPSNEMICSMRDPMRPINNFIFHIRKKNADHVVPADKLTEDNLTDEWKAHLASIGRKNPDGTFNLEDVPRMRQDPYGTSVLSIQVNRKSGYLKIINRYNHGIDAGPRSPDDAFGHNLNKIVAGLHGAIDRETQGVLGKSKQKEFLGKVASDLIAVSASGQHFIRWREFAGITYGLGYVMVGGVATLADPGSEIVVNGSILRNNTRFKAYEGEREATTLANLIDGSRIKIQGNKVSGTWDNGETWTATLDGVEISSFESDMRKLPENSFHDQISLTQISLLEATEIGKDSIRSNYRLTEVLLPKVEIVGDKCFVYNNSLTKISLPEATKIGDKSLVSNSELLEIDLPKVTTIGRDCLVNNWRLKTISLLKAISIGEECLLHNDALEEISFPEVKTIGSESIRDNDSLVKIDLPKAISIGNRSVAKNKSLIEILAPKLEETGIDSLFHNKKLKSIDFPNLKVVSEGSITDNDSLEEIRLESATDLGSGSIISNKSLRSVFLPNVKSVGIRRSSYDGVSLNWNKRLTEISLPKAISIHSYSISGNKSLKEVFLPRVTNIGNQALNDNDSLVSISLPELETLGEQSISNNKLLTQVSLPKTTLLEKYALSSNKSLERVSLPKGVKLEKYSLNENPKLKEITLLDPETGEKVSTSTDFLPASIEGEFYHGSDTLKDKSQISSKQAGKYGFFKKIPVGYITNDAEFAKKFGNSLFSGDVMNDSIFDPEDAEDLEKIRTYVKTHSIQSDKKEIILDNLNNASLRGTGWMYAEDIADIIKSAGFDGYVAWETNVPAVGFFPDRVNMEFREANEVKKESAGSITSDTTEFPQIEGTPKMKKWEVTAGISRINEKGHYLGYAGAFRESVTATTEEEAIEKAHKIMTSKLLDRRFYRLQALHASEAIQPDEPPLAKLNLLETLEKTLQQKDAAKKASLSLAN